MQTETLNIIDIIEKNPITKLSNTYNNKLLTKIKETFTEAEQQLFISSFYLYLNYNKSDFVVSLDDIWEWLGFSQKIRAKELVLKHFTENVDYSFTLSSESKKEDNNDDKFLLSLQRKQKEGRGGSNKITVLLTVKCFKLLCIKSGTKKANEIHEYFIKLEELLQDTILDECEEVKKQLDNKNQEIKKQLECKDKEHEVKLNKNFKNAFNKQSVVYIMKLQSFDDGTYIIKIGKTDNLTDRTSKLASLYCNKDQLVIMSVYPCEDNNNFEKFLHSNPYISQYKYTEMINNKATSIETYRINEINYEKIKRIIDNNIYNYNGKNLDTMKENNKSLELQLKIKELELKEKDIELKEKEIDFNNKLYENQGFFDKLIEYNKSRQNIPSLNTVIEDTVISTPITISTNSPINSVVELQNTITPTNIPIINNTIVKKKEVKDCGHYVQVYDGNDYTKLQYVYNGITDATRNMEGTSFTSIKNACKKKEIYKGYRWHLVNRNDPNPNEVKDIGSSIVPRQKLEGYIAMLNNDMTEVENLFIKQKDAATFIGQTVSAMSRAVNYKTILSNKYFILWDMVEEEIQNKYLETNELPIITDKQKAKKVHQINPDTDEVVKIHISLSDLIKELKIAPKTIKIHCNNNTIYNGYRWKII
jgi:hypothetical protein